MARLCACECGGELPPKARATRRYLDGHRQRAYRRRQTEPTDGFWGALRSIARSRSEARN